MARFLLDTVHFGVQGGRSLNFIEGVLLSCTLAGVALVAAVAAVAAAAGAAAAVAAAVVPAAGWEALR